MSNRHPTHGTSTLLTAAAAGLLLLAAPLSAQSTTHGMEHNTSAKETTMQHGSASGLASPDQKFLREAAQGGMMEVELGRLAADKAASADVKTFGQRMVDDHSQANDRLKALATAKSFTLPAGMSKEQQQMRDKLAKLSGAAFDRMYMDHMVKDHKMDVSEFEKESTKAKDTDVKTFASDTLPTLKEHLKMAQDIDSKMGGTKSASTKTGAKSTKPSHS